LRPLALFVPWGGFRDPEILMAHDGSIVLPGFQAAWGSPL